MRNLPRVQSLRVKLSVLFLTMVAVATLMMALSIGWISKDLKTTALTESLQRSADLLNETIDAERQRALAMATGLAHHPSTAAALAARDRETLAREYVPVFEELNRAFDIKQFQFHTAPATSFLRVHKPEKFGDDLSSFRHTITAANSTKEPVSGLERGRFGIGVRGVVPVFHNGEHVGSVEFGLGLHQAFLDSFTSNSAVPATLYRVEENGLEPFADTLEAELDASMISSALNEPIMMLEPEGLGGNLALIAVPINDYSQNAIGVAVLAVDKTRFDAIAERGNMLAFALAGVLAVIAALAILWLNRGIFSPLANVLEAMSRLSKGDTDLDIEGVGRKDEIGDIAAAVQVFRDNAIERSRLMSESEKEQEARAARQKAVEELIAGFRDEIQELLDDVAGNAERMQTTAKDLSSVATETSTQAGGAGSASQEASENVQAVAAATEELASSITEISQQTQQASRTAEKAVEAAETSNEMITGLATAAEKIDGVVALIRQVADQTNLLALNATIEAARAGEAGKGFAVVATEVKELAAQTGSATDEINTEIAAMQSATAQAVEAIQAITQTIGEVSTSANAIAAAVEEQGASTGEISSNVQRAATGASGVSENVAGVTRAAAETSQSADQVLAASDEVSTKTQRLRTVVDDFLGRVAAA